MFATMSQSVLPAAKINNADNRLSMALGDPSLLTEDTRYCPGCKKSVVSENGGVVVAFGQSFFHVDCFRCAKCSNQVTADTNLLLLSDGSPICANCSYCCNVCRQPILDEAIMTGEDSYHAHCFKCKVCKNRIDELVFAKTSQGIYCMDCHNQRVARSRRHAQRQRERDKEREREKQTDRNGSISRTDSNSSRSREGVTKDRRANPNGTVAEFQSNASASELRGFHQRNGSLAASNNIGPHYENTTSSEVSNAPNSIHNPLDATLSNPYDQPSRTGTPSSFTSQASLSATNHTPLVFSKRHSTMPPRPSSPSVRANSSRPSTADSSPTVAAPPSSYLKPSSPIEHARSTSNPTPKSEGLFLSPDAPGKLQKMKSYDDGVRGSPQLHASPSAASLGQNLTLQDNGTSRRDKRRSINPGVALAFANTGFDHSASAAANSADENVASPPAQVRSAPGRDSPQMYSPLRDYFAPDEEDTTSSHIPAIVSHSSPPTASLNTYEPIIPGRTRSASASTFADETFSRPGSLLERPPPRTTSRRDDQGSPAGHLHSTPSSAKEQQTNGTGRRLERPPSLDLRQRSHGEKRSGPGSRGSKSSFGTFGRDFDQRAHTPTSPAHFADVPHGIESASDTEAESEDMYGSREADGAEDDGIPPALPPKENAPSKSNDTRPPLLRVDTNDISIEESRSDSSHIDSEDGVSEISPESSPVERTSHSTFIAPALPPIRFSTQSGFSDLWKTVGSGNGIASLGAMEVMNEEQVDPQRPNLLMASPSPSAQSFDSLKRPMTPRSDITVVGLDLSAEETPVKRRNGVQNGDAQHQRYDIDLSLGRDGSSSTSASSTSSPEDHMRAFALPLTRRGATLEVDERNTDSNSDSSHSADSHQLKRRRSMSQQVGRSQSAQDDRTSVDLQAFHNTRPSLDILPTRRDALFSSPQNGEPGQTQRSTRITITAPEASPGRKNSDPAELVKQRIQEAVSAAAERGSGHVRLDVEFVEAIIQVLNQRKEECDELKHKLDGLKRASQQYMAGMTVAQTEYDRELQARRDTEAEVTRLRVLLSGLRLTAISGETKRQEAQTKLSQELKDSLTNLEKSLSKLKVERDLTIAEVEQLSASKSSPNMDNADGTAVMSRALSMRFDNIRTQYQHELLPLTEQREALTRELAELKASRDAFLEETTVLNARNEELAQLNAQYVRRMDLAGMDTTIAKDETGSQEKHDGSSSDRARSPPNILSSSVTAATLTNTDESPDSKFVKVSKQDTLETPAPPTKPTKFKWIGSKAQKENLAANWQDTNKAPSKKEHAFQQISMLRVVKCDHCGDKMWGSQLRCTGCHIAVHTRCLQFVRASCVPHNGRQEEAPLLPHSPSMFGRDLLEQVRSDSRDQPRVVPVIVEKCIDAVDHLALDYEGIYRKTGGSGQSKTITQLFERGDYNAFDLRDTERFNDICSVTSVLKTYFRTLPNPLLTHDLHDQFLYAASQKDENMKSQALTELVQELPREHWYTTRAMMLHLHRVSERSGTNLMHAQNLGMVFGPTLMRSRDPNAEFSDMAGKALTVEWLIRNAPSIFELPPSS